MKKENIEELKTYLGEVGNLFSQRKKSCIDLIFALLTNHGTRAKTVVELSLSRFFKRQYSSISCAISGYFTSRKIMQIETSYGKRRGMMSKAFYWIMH